MWNDYISVSLICLDSLNLERDISFLIKKGIHNFHADFMDNTLVPRLGISPETIQQLKKKFNEDINIDSHLMIKNPERCFDVIAPYSDWVTIHYEAQEDPLRLVQILKKKYKCKVAIAFNVLTEIPKWFWFCDDIDGILLMGISPGVLGTNHYEEIVYEKLMLYRRSYSRLKPIFIDGAVTFTSIKRYYAYDAGRNYTTVICGSSTLLKGVDFSKSQDINNQTIDKNIEELQKCIQ